jgi:hypothetical protein
MNDAAHKAADSMEGMENMPVLLGYNGNRSYACSVAFLVLVVGFAALNAKGYAEYVVMDQPFLIATGWKTLSAHLAVCAVSVVLYWTIARQSMDILPKCFILSGSNAEDFLYSKICRIDVLRDFRGQAHLVFLKAEGMKIALGIGALSRMDDMSESLVSAVKNANPWVVVQYKTRPRLILTCTCGVVLGLLTFFYLWITVGLAPHIAPLLPVFPALLLFGLELVLIGALQWTLSGYRLSSVYLVMSGQILLLQMVYLFLTLFVQHVTGGSCC